MAPKHIKGSREIYKAVAADAAACGMTPKQFAERFVEEALRELRKLNWISRRAARQRSLPKRVYRRVSPPRDSRTDWAVLVATGIRGESTSRRRRFLGTLGLPPIYSHLPKIAHAAGIVVTSPTRARVDPTAFRCSAPSRSAKSRAISAPSKARAAIMNAGSGRLSRISFTIVQIVEFARR
jgi:hypothetical protein